MEPLDADAALAFYRAGPQPTPALKGLAAPKTRWVSEAIPGSIHRRWSLTGLGAEFGDDIVGT
jgi:hypothetical protein